MGADALGWLDEDGQLRSSIMSLLIAELIIRADEARDAEA